MDKSSLIFVTGANGHVGFNLVKMLLENGYTNLRVSVRDSNDSSKTGALKALGVQNFVSLDIRDEETFKAVSQGVDVLFHVAATYRIHTGSAEADAEMIEDSLAGVRSALSAAAANAIGKVVLTSSVVALPHTPLGGTPPNEKDWVENPQVPYTKAKSEAEKLAWSMAQELDVDLVTILPGPILGQNFGSGTQSTDFILAIMMGSMRMGTIEAIFPIIDVRDVVRGHILAAEKDSKGRFILAPDTPASMKHVAETMRNINPEVPKSMMVVPRFMYSMLPFFDWLSHKTAGSPRTMTPEAAKSLRSSNLLADNSKAKRELGWSQQVSLEQSLRDTMDELKRLQQRISPA